ncbi:hypothetical protein OSB04_028118 [Centaurea solstitialis]|uniref:DUF4371 domain-containing protein n=1 Tax=Centaurea solstitialis TaxID=347529 RepID=A0AA38VXD0_9ASTR|nr:hypothetical protein OSB04_028118 [Centaurea solstitialis]
MFGRSDGSQGRLSASNFLVVAFVVGIRVLVLAFIVGVGIGIGIGVLVAFVDGDESIGDVVLENAPHNAKYTSPNIQKEILHVYAMNVQEVIRDEIGRAKFCLIVDESKTKQMTIVVLINRNGYAKERFLNLVHVKDTTSLTLKIEISLSSSFHKLDVQDIWGQGYDGASNMHVLNDIATEGSTYSQTVDARYALTHALSFDFIIVLHMMKEILEITDKLCQTLQQKSQDIVNALALGNRAQDFVEMEQEVYLEKTQELDDDLLSSDYAISRNTNLQNDETSPNFISSKRKSRSDYVFNNAVGLIAESLKEISKDLSKGIIFDMKINELSENIPSKIFKMNTLTQIEKFKALSKIRSDPINVYNFWQLEEGNREAWVKYILEK